MQMTILELDAGNTRLKWRLIQEDVILHRGELNNTASWETYLPVILDRLGSFDLARASVVSGSERHKLLFSMIQQSFGVEFQAARTKACWRGLTLAYHNPSALGVDRWLAMLAAHCVHKVHHKIIIDSGTALTIDVINQYGEHQGGYIVPGVTLMKQALQINTANLPVTENIVESVTPGKTTVQCIDHGVLAMTVAMINAQLGKFKNSVVYLTGGSSPVLLPHINAECVYQPELVMDGLALAFKED